MSVNKQERQKRAQERQAFYDSLTVEEKIARAESQPGESKKQLAKLRKLQK